MKISGFSMIKNSSKLYYPIQESIRSILPIVDEFVVAVGDCDKDDNTRELIEGINSDKIKIIDTVWDLEKYPYGMENAHQTDIAKAACTGDWLFYLQADEVVHEKYLEKIVESCKKYLNDKEVEGFLFKYIHFWGDYNRYHKSHSWYPKEIRIIRNDKEIHSWESAQSFRRIPNFNGINYR
ncbi:MAG: glycosyltransferase, partial [Fusobacteria bacterium]|nr:glycosyltransferase [Fusobacteriota bacterium]